MNQDDFVPMNPDDNPFIDNEALRELMEKVVDVLRPIGLTVQPEGIAFMMHPEHGMNMMIQVLVRPSAQEKITEDKASREEFNIMMADSNEALVKTKADEVMAAIEGDLEGILFGDAEVESECSHKRRHPSGHCLDCGYGMEEVDDDETGGTQPTPA
jgi:hypothetical protein